MAKFLGDTGNSKTSEAYVPDDSVKFHLANDEDIDDGER